VMFANLMRIRLPIPVTDRSQIINLLADTQILKGRTAWRYLPSIFLILHNFDNLSRFFRSTCSRCLLVCS
jgi:hypothetical protein